MTANTKNRNFFKWPNLLYFKPESACSEMPDTILEEDHPRIIPAKFG
jgi:hypothetical protein